MKVELIKPIWNKKIGEKVEVDKNKFDFLQKRRRISDKIEFKKKSIKTRDVSQV